MKPKPIKPKPVVAVRVPPEVRRWLIVLACRQRPKQRLSDYVRAVLVEHVQKEVAA